ncbi:putative phage infection (PIP) family protein YhgE [Alkaliphilus hydrothermalis]|uniref:Phage infection (PIP) family protein YhgE n=1 Tax=Alkaliphilus hydrothermalis TaxID=1482730 RepID=A0ABS2NMV7_9FIRM|nr:putative phage infection (PIP) family protein YhgE [Alkaliphilus hydrothermalis]
MKLLELISRFIPEKILYFSIILGVVGLLIIGLRYGEFSITVGTIAVLFLLLKNEKCK